MARSAWLVEPEGLVPYDVANAGMHELADRRLAGEAQDTVILLEHPPVFTAGRRAKPEELLVPERQVEERGGIVRWIDRGGSFTFHGPGQLVGYPVLDLGAAPDAARYLRSLEEVVLRTGRDLGADLTRRDDVQTGVWHGDRKVCAIGVRLMRTRITLHGFALNCAPDLRWFDDIVACGLRDHGVTSLSDVLGREVSVDEVRPLARGHLADVLGLEFESAPAADFLSFATR